MTQHTMSPGDVARALGVSTERVRQLDDVLLPVRLIGSRHRRYDPAVVREVAASRSGVSPTV